MAIAVGTVALAVQDYSVTYLHDDDRYPPYAAQVSLFTAAMLLVVVSGDLILLLVGRGDIEPDVSAQREMLRTFVAPAFAPTPAEPAPPSAARSTRATKRA